MKTLLFILLLTPPIENPCLQIDILIVGDFSGSIDGYEGYMKKSFITLLNKLELSEETVKLGLVTFASESYLDASLSTDKKSLQVAIDNIYHSSGSTNMTSGLQLAINELVNNGRPGFRKIIILVSDGQPDDKYSVKQITDQLKSFDIKIYGMLITSIGYDEAFMKSISSVYLKSDYESLSEEIKKLDICL